MSPQLHHLGESHVCRVSRFIKLTSPGDISEDFGILNIAQLCCSQIEEDWGHDVCGLVLGYDQNILLDNI
jgi:hypothetical protein